MTLLRIVIVAFVCAGASLASAQDATGKVSVHNLGGAPQGSCDSWVDENGNGKRDRKERRNDYRDLLTGKPDETVIEGGDGVTIEKEFWRRPAQEDDILPEGTTVWEEVFITTRDDDGKLIEERYIYPEGASGGFTTRYNYDERGRLISYVQDGPGNTTTVTELAYEDGELVRVVSLSNMGASQDAGSEWHIISEGGDVVRIVSDRIERTSCSADFGDVRRLCRQQGLTEDDWVESERIRKSAILTYVYGGDGRIRAQRRLQASPIIGITTSTIYYEYECD